jgi:hypothetical protein
VVALIDMLLARLGGDHDHFGISPLGGQHEELLSVRNRIAGCPSA